MSIIKESVISIADADEIGYNDTVNPHFSDILDQRVSRRNMLRGGAATTATAILGTLSLSACGGGSDFTAPVATPSVAAASLLAFTAVPKSLLDEVIVPAGYTASVLYALGDPLNSNVAAYRNDGTDSNYDSRAGDHHDGMDFFGLTSDGRPSASAFERGLLAMNHEATTNNGLPSHFLHADGGTDSLPRPATEVDKEVDVHGISVVEVRKSGATWEYVQNFRFNRRLTPLTPVELSGPVRGNALLQTKYDRMGRTTRGTLNNCGAGKTPWGTLVSGEENWNGYFTRNANDDIARNNDKSVAALNRYGRSAGRTSRHGWETGGTDDKYARWDISQGAGTATTDYRNELNCIGYIIEVDPYTDTTSRKRTALGRFGHENAAFGNRIVGQQLAVYMGDDSRNEYIYKFVSDKAWVAADATASDRLATGSSYLDMGKLYVAKFNVDGRGEWIELTINNSVIAGYSVYAFADQADVLVNARLAADAVGATKMDRPEWAAVNPVNGEVYYTLTNNSNRRVAPSGSQSAPDSANPRVYTDDKDGVTSGPGNRNGHILRLREDTTGGAAAAAISFAWDIYLFGAEATADKGTVNLSSLTDDQDFSSPDGMVFTPSTGICWIQTDDGAYTDVTNCMMLASLPGQVGDGEAVTLNYPAGSTTSSVTTQVGRVPSANNLKRFLVGPAGSEITGLCESPDGKAMFINIQHPGERTDPADILRSDLYQSQWPSNTGYGRGRRPRSATIVITKDDGGRIGS